jgi:hypothetical protein
VFNAFTKSPYGLARGVELLEKTLELPVGQYRLMSLGLSCATCGAQPLHYCTTASGRRASRNHRDRYLMVMAAVFAMQDETTIHEEPDPADLLSHVD